MRIAFALASVSPLRAMEPGAIHLEWLRALSEDHSLELFLDQANAASDELRQSGVRTFISIKRRVEFLDGETVSADAFQAMALRRSHESDPFDAVIYGGDLTVDFAWFEPSLKTIPRGVALGAGLAQDLNAVWEDRRLFISQVRRIWSQTGLLSSADFILSDLSPEVFGLTDDGTLPPRYTTEDGPAPGALREDPGPDPRNEPTRADSPPRSVVVAATFSGARGLEQLVDRVLEYVPPRSSTTYVVLVRPRCSLGVPAKEALLQHCPEDLRRQIVLVSTGDDEIAADFLGAADLIVAASLAELAVPALAEASAQKPTLVLEDGRLPTPCKREPEGCFPQQRPTKRWHGEASHSLHVLTWEEPPPRFAQALEALSADLSGDELVVIHAPDRLGPGADLFPLAGLGGVDLVVWGRPDGVFMHPEPHFIFPYAFAIRGAMAAAAARAVRDCDSIWQLICWALSGEWVDRSRLMMLPGPPHLDYWEVQHVEQVTTTWSPSSGVLPPPRWLPSGGQVVIPTPYPEPVSFPKWPARSGPSADAQGLENWAQNTKWGERVRLALPWKLGILDRAMKGRW